MLAAQLGLAVRLIREADKLPRRKVQAVSDSVFHINLPAMHVYMH